MTLSKLQKDIQTMSFNEGQINLINCLMKDGKMLWDNSEKLEQFLSTWRSKCSLENHIIDTKYEDLNQ